MVLRYGAIKNQGPLAQSVEQRTFNPWVVGSIPTGPTLNSLNYYKNLPIFTPKETTFTPFRCLTR